MGRASIDLTSAVVLLAVTVLPPSSWAAEPPPLPNMSPDAHLGVASCASATCHGATSPVPGGVVLQNEYVTWQTRDPHSRAYATLLSEESQRIARNLGLPDAHTADVCLDCHADNVSSERRGPRFQLEDGGWSWCEYGKSDPWMTAYVCYGLIQARDAGFPVNKDILDRGISRLAEMTRRPKLDADTRAYGYYVLALAEGGERGAGGAGVAPGRGRLGPLPL